MFPGQGSQVVGMGKRLYDTEKVAREVFDETDSTLGRKFSDVVFNGDISELTKTQNAQLAIMTVSVALMRVICNKIGKPVVEMSNYLAGHSLGEYSALCISNALSLSDTVKLLKFRSEAMSNATTKASGSMLALIASDRGKIENLKKEMSFEIANDNSETQVIVSGTLDQIERIVNSAPKFGIRTKKLNVEGAFHSSLMTEASQKMEEVLERFQMKDPDLPIISNVTAVSESHSDTIKNLLPEQIKSTVRWRESIAYSIRNGVEFFVEVGPKNVLSSFLKKNTQIQSISVQETSDIGKLSRIIK